VHGSPVEEVDFSHRLLVAGVIERCIRLCFSYLNMSNNETKEEKRNRLMADVLTAIFQLREEILEIPHNKERRVGAGIDAALPSAAFHYPEQAAQAFIELRAERDKLEEEVRKLKAKIAELE
jgi:hypothetical protein